MPKATFHKSRLAVSAIFGVFAAFSFVGGIASNILANYVSPWFDHHKWVVWLACVVAIIVAVAVVVWEKADGAKPEAPSSSVQAPGDRTVAIGGDTSGPITTGDGNVVGSGSQGDVVGRDKITNIHHHHQAPTERSASRQLPAPKPDFTGRRAELDELKAHLRQNGQRGVAIAGAQGMGGVGKTELAVKLADELKEDYPDAQIFFDLRGVSERPVASEQALEHAIRSLDPAMIGRLPEAIGELQSLYRSLLDGKRALLVWDNARDAAQVEPLIPPAGLAMIVTSRLHFTLPGLFARNLEALPEDDARQLLQRIARRLTDAQAGALAKLCGRLPLALRLVGSALAERPNIKPEKYAEQLADEGKRLALVDASLSLSFALLDETQRTLWPRLAVFPGAFDDAAAAAVWRMETDDATNALAELIRYSLVDYDAQSERYELHDLARLFADSRMEEQERHATRAFHAQYFRNVLAEAGNLYLAGHEQIKAGLALFDRERANIEAGMAWALTQLEANLQARLLCVEYPDAGTDMIILRLHSREWIRWLEGQLAAARQLRWLNYERAALGNFGTAHRALGETRKAIEFYEQSLTIAREIGDRYGEGTTLGGLGVAYANLGETRRAIEFYEQCLAIAREIGDRRGEGSVLCNLGAAYADLGEAHKAIESQEQYLAIAREIGDRRGEGYAVGNLGLAYANLGEARKAIEFYEQALIIDREIGDRRGEGIDLGNLGLAYITLGEARKAVEFQEQCLAIAREIGDRRGEGNALNNLGAAYADLGEARKAIEFYEQCLAIACEIGDRRGEGNAVGNLGSAYVTLGEARKAIEFYEQALIIDREIGDRRGEGIDLGNLGNAYVALGEARKAIEFYEQCLAIACEIGDRRGEGSSLGNLGAAYVALGEARKAIEFQEQYLAIAREIGDRRGEGSSLCNMALALDELGERGRAVECAEAALKIFEEIESPHAAKVRARLAEWRGQSGAS